MIRSGFWVGTKASSKTRLARSRAWIGILMILPAATAVALSQPRNWTSESTSLVFQALGWILFTFGALYRWWATLYIGGRKGEVLVCDGPYSQCRNPLYFGTFLITMAIPVMVQSLLLATTVLAASVFYLHVTVRDEERRLQQRFGSRFLEYRSDVPMFWPRLGRYHASECVEVRLEGLRAELLRSLRWCWVPFLCHVFVVLRVQAWWPHYFDLP